MLDTGIHNHCCLRYLPVVAIAVIVVVANDDSLGLQLTLIAVAVDVELMLQLLQPLLQLQLVGLAVSLQSSC